MLGCTARCEDDKANRESERTWERGRQEARKEWEYKWALAQLSCAHEAHRHQFGASLARRTNVKKVMLINTGVKSCGPMQKTLTQLDKLDWELGNW